MSSVNNELRAQLDKIMAVLDDQSSDGTDEEILLIRLPTLVERLKDIKYQEESVEDLQTCVSLFGQADTKLQTLISKQSTDAAKFILSEQRSALLKKSKEVEKHVSDCAAAAIMQQLEVANQQLEVAKGKFFLSIDQVFEASIENFTECDPGYFNRRNTTTVNAKNDCYTRTRDGALNDDNVTKFDSATTDPSKNSTSNPIQQRIDIFGISARCAESAHLMPHCPKCAAMWFSIVPWILHIDEVSVDNVNDVTSEKEKKWDVVQKCIHGFGVSATKEYVGIKRFPTNRINLREQATYLHTVPCVFIIPILADDKVKNWSGEAYSAIVLAGDDFCQLVTLRLCTRR